MMTTFKYIAAMGFCVGATFAAASIISGYIDHPKAFEIACASILFGLYFLVQLVVSLGHRAASRG